MENKRRNLNSVIISANIAHDYKYDYDKSSYEGMKTKTTITCPIHGDFIITWDNHINGRSGCPKCAKCNKWTNEEWIEEVSKRHSNKYDYSKTIYTKAKEKVVVICHKKDECGIEHGEFLIRAGNHMAGIGCPKCAGKYHYTTEEWIRKANMVHNNKYQYNKTIYKQGSSKLIITCPIHGDFEQAASSHLMGCGCPACNGGVVSNKETFIKRANIKHNNKYNYDKFKYVNFKTKGIIICPRHGEFEQTPDTHINRGHGCPKCKNSFLEQTLVNLFDKHNIKYIYQYHMTEDSNSLKADFYLNDYEIIIECQGEQHFVPTNFGNKNVTEDEVLQKYNDLILRDKKKYEMAINDGFEVIYFTLPHKFHIKNVNVKSGWYKDKFVLTTQTDLKNYILNKTKKQNNNNITQKFFDDVKANVLNNMIQQGNKLIYNEYVILFKTLEPNERNQIKEERRYLQRKGYKVIIVFEDEYIQHRTIVLSKLQHITKNDFNKEKIMARKCIIRKIDHDIAQKFLNINHIQGYVASTIHLGAFYQEKLVGVMSFLNENEKWTLTRFASDNTYICSGLGGKLFNFFIKNYNYKEIKSFADKRWTINQDNIYIKLGFKEQGSIQPEYRYINKVDKERYHKFNFRKKILLKRYPDAGLTEDMTEYEMTQKLGFYRIWDCGLIKYVYTNPNFKVNK